VAKARFEIDGNIVFEFEAAAYEFEAVLASTLRVVRASEPTPADPAPSQAKLHEMVEKLPEDTLGYLRLLVEEPEGLTDGEVIELLQLDGGRRKLAGVNGSVTKAADRAGITTPIVKRTVTRGTDGERRYHYQVPGSILPLLEQALPEEDEPEPEAGDFLPPPPADDDFPF
jgi:hypothetical protein